MSRIFNINFTYLEREYKALLILNGNGEASLRVTSENLEIYLPHGRLSFSIGVIIHQISQTRKEDRSLHLTDTISLQLLEPLN